MLYFMKYNISRHFYISGTEIKIFLCFNLSDVLYFTNTTSLDIYIYIFGTEIKIFLCFNLSDVLHFTNTTSLDISYIENWKMFDPL